MRTKTRAFYFSTEFLGCVECECFAGAVWHCNFALRVATKLTWVGACIPPGPQNASRLAAPTAWPGNEEAMQKLDLMLHLVLLFFIFVPASLTPIQSLQDCKSFHSRRPTEHRFIPAATSTAHPSSQPQPQPPSYHNQAQLNTTGKCETLY